MVKDLSVSLCGLSLKNPVIPASGTFGFGLEMADAMDLNVLGGISLKGSTREARYGNPVPRIADCTAGMINSVGLQNPGIDVLVNEKVPALRRLYDGCIIANISGFSVEEYRECCTRADECEGIDLIEVNISCPNVHGGGLAFGTSAAAAAQVTSAVKEACHRKPVFIKLSPNVTDIVEIARACEDAGADGLTLVNTFLGMRIDIARRKPVLRQRHLSHRPPDGIPGGPRLPHPGDGLRRSHQCPGSGGNDDGRGYGRPGGGRKPSQPLRLPGNHKHTSSCNGRTEYQHLTRDHRNRMNRRDVIIACDFPDRETTLAFLDRFEGGRKPFVKIGMELFYGAGPQIVRDIKARGHRIFLDLKLHDIPNTVKKAMQVLSALDIDMVNVHASGAVAMMKAAVEGLTRADGTRPLLIAVTQLTSTSEETLHRELLIGPSMNETIEKYASNAREAGLDGVVCSPLEAGLVKAACGKDFLTVTPGIRFADAAADDQVRITTPARAREIGSDYIVVGRPITAAEDPVAAYKRCIQEFV